MGERIESIPKRHSQTAAARPNDAARESSWLPLAAGGALAISAGLLGAGSVLPGMSSWIAAANKHGFSAGSFALGGVLILGLNAIARRQRSIPATAPIEPEPVDGDRDLVLDQVAADLAQARGALKDLRVELVYVKDAVQGSKAARNGRGARDESHSEDASFRMAASVDQLGSRLEARITKQEDMTIDALAEIQRSMQETRARLAELSQRVESATTGEHVEVDSIREEFTRVDIEPREGFEPCEDDMHVSVELEEDPPTDLGLFDRLDDAGSLRPARTSPSDAPRIDAEALDLLDLGSRFDSKARDEHEVASKLGELRELLADPRVRAAFERGA